MARARTKALAGTEALRFLLNLSSSVDALNVRPDQRMLAQSENFHHQQSTIDYQFRFLESMRST